MKRGVMGAIAAVGIAAAILLALPALIGYSAEESLRATLKTISQQGAYRIELVDFRRGWFSSHARSKLVLEGQYADTLEQTLGLDPGTALEVRFAHTISHGPILLRGAFPYIGYAYAETELRLPQMIEQLLSQYLQGKPFLTFRTTFGLFGRSTTMVSNPDYTGAMGPHTSVQWDGASGRIGAERRAFNVRLDMPLFKWEAGERLLLLRGMAVRSAQKKRGRHIWLGDTDAHVNEVRLMNPESGESVRIDDLDYKVRAAADGAERLDASAVFGIGAAEFEGGTLGPSAWTLEVNNLSVSALDDAYDLYNKFLDSGDRPQVQRDVLNQFLNTSLTGLLSSPVELRTAVAINIDGPFAIYKGTTALSVDGKDGDVTIAIDQQIDALDYDEIRMTEGTGRLRLARLDGNMLGELYGDFVRIVATGLPEAQQEEEMARMMSQKGPAIIRPHTRLHLENVAITMPVGTATASGELGFKGDAPLDYSSVENVVRRLEGSLKARVSNDALVWALTRSSARTLRARLREQGRDLSEDMITSLAATTARTDLAKLERQSVVRKDGDAYVLEALFRDGKVVLNGVSRPDLAPKVP
ncbi:DUF945 family protein [Emcibacter sp. SYSU 3D8]|uniref:DUF945 family protein n=1 Tax=Emcibacter sp. SYSU 3D8 TaxID=3133969 RepID=UPI0031FE7527